uniref:Uncharacterized protein n=1 Tax=Euplotes crassus TaxID=5936 RepID=A0A7S3KDG9_EUPCR|mmetsp:Transcript_22069/g.21838  ORF Transcript_22069/g.21838 Transcript_22069/m.21838 type:complete len:155 (+) Transcript_22069:966-1430(+)|eukprot:CAMPEP_0197007902 /NCGR_PEP_ID=MMETSP1380-20130617/42824_1 /TAXON_ID=5936 /ORGANISM="Euplotes crassus, Strain CT5" /LENGTH=154 /DNA_ID=CAMNT_0042428213 /DNA_START=947 /DNA_END=1411 /DNA_ORIENTATION=+
MASQRKRNKEDTLGSNMFQEMKSTLSNIEASMDSPQDPIQKEYIHLKESIYPFWQSTFHHLEWNDDSDANKIKSREELKERMLDSLQYFSGHKLYRYADPADVKRGLLQNYPFVEDSDSKTEVKLLEGKFHMLKIIVDGITKKIRVSIIKKDFT